MTESPDKSAPLYNEGWRIAVIYFGLVSFGFAQPVYESVDTFRRQFHFGPADAFLIVLAFQCLPAAVLIGLRRLARKSRLRFWLDAFVIIVALTIALRQMKVVHLNTLASSELKFIITAGLIIAVLAVLIFFRRAFMITVFYAGLAAPAFGAFFIYDTAARAAIIADLGPPSASGPPVVLVISDKLSTEILRGPGGGPGGGIDAETFPNFAHLAERGVFWSNAASNYWMTRYSVPSFLTSRILSGDSDIVDEDLERLPPHSLFDAFEKAGYRIHVYSDYFGCKGRRFMCTSYFDSERPGFLGKVFMHFVEHYGPDKMLKRRMPLSEYRQIQESNAYLVETVRNVRPGNFYFIHLMNTHDPYIIGPDGGYRYTRKAWFKPGEDNTAVIANYRDQTRYTDKVIGRVLDAYDSRPADQPLILALTSDHGFCPIGECLSPELITPSAYSVPMMLLSPFHAPRTDEGDYQSIDLAPTLCEAADLTNCADWGFEGVPRLSGAPPPRPRRFYMTHDRSIDVPLPAPGAHAD